MHSTTTLRCCAISLSLCISHANRAEEIVSDELRKASELVAALLRSPSYPSESILAPEQLESVRDFITGGNPAIAEILWPKQGTPQPGTIDPDPKTIDSSGAHIWFRGLLWPDETVIRQLQQPRRAEAETARWRFASQVHRFLKPEHCPSDPFRESRALKDYPSPALWDWTQRGTVDKVITRYKKADYWFELQDDGRTLSILALRHNGTWSIEETEPVRQALMQFLNLEQEKRERLTITREESRGIVYGHFKLEKESLIGHVPSNAESRMGEGFDIWQHSHDYCTDGRFLFIKVSECYDAHCMYFGGGRYPDRF